MLKSPLTYLILTRLQYPILTSPITQSSHVSNTQSDTSPMPPMTGDILHFLTPPVAHFNSLPPTKVLTLHMDVPESWLVQATAAEVDLDNFKPQDLGALADVLHASYLLCTVAVHCFCALLLCTVAVHCCCAVPMQCSHLDAF